MHPKSNAPTARRHWPKALRSEVEYFVRRLDDLALIERAVIVRQSGSTYLAVPVGGRRRGGFLCVASGCGPREIATQLSAYPDLFPNPRVVFTDEPGLYPDNVMWGDEPPPMPEIDAPLVMWVAYERACGRLYGYSETAIRKYVAERF